MITFFSSLLILFFSNSNPSPKTDTLHIKVSNIASGQGIISMALYDKQETFCKEEGFVSAQNFTIDSSGEVVVQMDDIPYGTYAIAMYHDVNSNGKMDKNVIGIPKEPYAFSNKVRAKWSEPTFDETKFTFEASSTSHEVEIRYWSDQ